MARVVKRYANRKLYDTTTSRYVALDDIAALIRSGEEVEVTDNETGADLTAVTLAQIILEEERRHKSITSLPLLRELVRYGGDAIAGVTSRGMEALGERLQDMRELAERRVSEIVNEGGVRPAILDEVLTSSKRRIEDLQRRVDQGIKGSLERLRSYPGIGVEVERLEARVREIENRIRKLLAGENGAATEREEQPAADAPQANRPPTTEE
jgi:polyhydroxyalkanoate synthesis repressor PhaR